MNLLSDYFKTECLIRDASINHTMYPSTSKPASVCYAFSPHYIDIANQNPNVLAVITTNDFAMTVTSDKGLVITDDPQQTYYQLHNYLVEHCGMAAHKESNVHTSALIASTVIIGENVRVGKNVTICDYAIIGDNTIIGESTYIGERVVTGARGMQNLRVDGRLFPIKYAGGVKVGRGCEVLTGAIIQRPYHAEYTEIGNDTQISVNVVVAHGCKVGSNVMLAGHVQLAGNVRLGDGTRVGPSSVIADAVTIGDDSQISLGSVVIKDVPSGSSISGNYAIEHKKHLRGIARMINDNQ